MMWDKVAEYLANRNSYDLVIIKKFIDRLLKKRGL